MLVLLNHCRASRSMPRWTGGLSGRTAQPFTSEISPTRLPRRAHGTIPAASLGPVKTRAAGCGNAERREDTSQEADMAGAPEVDFSITSPLSTGGGGVEFEKEVYAYYLALLLLEATPFGLPAGVIRQIEAQRAFQNEPLD